MRSILILGFSVMLPAVVSANQLVVTMEFPAGFKVSINGGPLNPSGPIKVQGILDSSTVDTLTEIGRGDFPLSSVYFTGAGYVHEPVITPLSFATFLEDNFGIRKTGQVSTGIIGWNGTTSAGPFMSNLDDLSTLVSLPYTTSGANTFFYTELSLNAWALAGGDSIGASTIVVDPPGTPSGIFSIELVPEPSSLVLIGLSALSVTATRRHRSVPHNRV